MVTWDLSTNLQNFSTMIYYRYRIICELKNPRRTIDGSHENSDLRPPKISLGESKPQATYSRQRSNERSHNRVCQCCSYHIWANMESPCVIWERDKSYQILLQSTASRAGASPAFDEQKKITSWSIYSWVACDVIIPKEPLKLLFLWLFLYFRHLVFFMLLVSCSTGAFIRPAWQRLWQIPWVASKNNLNIDDRLHQCLMSKFVTPFTCKLKTKSFADTVFTIVDQNNQALVIYFFFKVGNLGI